MPQPTCDNGQKAGQSSEATRLVANDLISKPFVQLNNTFVPHPLIRCSGHALLMRGAVFLTVPRADWKL
jgi:hypothetical protein